MQTFLPYPDFQQSARCLDNRRLGKQRVECLQILKTLAFGPYQKRGLDSENNIVCWIKCDEFEYDYTKYYTEYQKHEVRKTPWYNHPAVKMWKGYEWKLHDYLTCICGEWTYRGFKDTCRDKLCSLILKFAYQSIHNNPPWFGDVDFHLSHQSNLIRKNPSYYRPIFGPEIPDNLPYIWPV